MTNQKPINIAGHVNSVILDALKTQQPDMTISQIIRYVTAKYLGFDEATSVNIAMNPRFIVSEESLMDFNGV